jgi:hypothetical protein
MLLAAAAAAALATQALASPPPDTVKPAPPTTTNPPPPGPQMPPSQPGDVGPNGAVTPGLKVGMPVKDSSGATIGAVSEMKPEGNGSGRMFATVKMGADQFAVDASSLQVANGVATINMSQDQIAAMIHPKG